MNKIICKTFQTLLIISIFFTYTISAQEAQIDESAPDFTLIDSNGNEHTLSYYSGKFVVLEWINYECPFVKKHYNSSNMQNLQKFYTEKDVVWLTICSSASGKQGYFSVDEINERSEEHGAAFTGYLIDEEGGVGKMYGAKTTPHMYIINPEGILIYAGGIDNKKSTNVDDIKIATNYVIEALERAMEGEEVEVKVSQPYGCSVKYK